MHRISRMLIGLVIGLGATGFAAPALAQPLIVADSGDSAWLIASALLALAAATSGVIGGYRESGRSATVAAALAIAVLVFVGIGYSLAFGPGSPWLGGAANLLLANLADVRDTLTVPESAFVLYELAIAMTAVALLVGAIVHRSRAVWLVPFVGLWTLIVYVPIARWTWSGWLTDLGAIDTAGGIVVLIATGVAALVVTLLLRRTATTMLPPTGHFGEAAAVIGWLAIVGGAATGAGDDAAATLLNAILAMSAGGLLSAAIAARQTGPARDRTVVLGLAGALAAVSAGASFVGPLGAMLLGALGSVTIWLVARLDRRDRTPPLVFVAAAAATGSIVFPVFILPGLGGPGFTVQNALVTQFAAQAVAVIAVALWAAVGTVIAALMISIVAPMRVADEGVSPPS